MVKKIIIGVVIIGLIIGGYFIGKNYYYNKIYNYDKIINTDMENYYRSNDTTDIDNIRALIPLYEDNEDIIYDIKLKVFNIFDDWFQYTDSKYVCTLDSVNECVLQQAELEDLSERIIKLRISDVIDPDKEKVLAKQIDKRISEIKEIVENKDAKRGETYDEHRRVICSKVNDDDCELQKDGTSRCLYTLGTIKEIVFCKRATTSNEK